MREVQIRPCTVRAATACRWEVPVAPKTKYKAS